MSRTKIVVVKRRQVILTGAIAVAAVLLVIFMLSLILNSREAGTLPQTQTGEVQHIYRPGIYSSIIQLGDSTLSIQVALDFDHVSSVTITNLDESAATMYPLIEPSIVDISEQLRAGTSIDGIKLSEESRYTQTLLLDAVREVMSEYTY